MNITFDELSQYMSITFAKNVRIRFIFEQYFEKNMSLSDFLDRYFYRAALKNTLTDDI